MDMRTANKSIASALDMHLHGCDMKLYVQNALNSVKTDYDAEAADKIIDRFGLTEKMGIKKFKQEGENHG